MGESFTSLFKSGAGAADLAAHLDALEEELRLSEIREFPGSLQAELYDRVGGSRPCRVDDFVPQVGSTIVYSGKNSAPAFKNFAKLFFRPAGGEVIGYNEQAWRAFSGPGYFVAYDDPQNPEVVFDYTKTPSFRPEGWPEIKPNRGLIAGPAFGNMLDYNRWVSQSTVIGRAFKNGKQIAHYLVTRTSKPR